jgi:hypothetical protein
MDDGTYGREDRGEDVGFWLRGDSRAEVVLRALEPVRQMRFALTGGEAGAEVSVSVGGVEERLRLQPRETREVVLDTAPGFQYYDSFVHVLHLRSRGSAPAEDGRNLGSFVKISLEVNKRY